MNGLKRDSWMMGRRYFFVLGLLLLVGGLACNAILGDSQETAEPATTTSEVVTNSEPTRTSPPEDTAVPTFTPLPQPQGEYVLNRLVTSTRDSFDGYPMRIYSVEFGAETLVFVVGFENHNDNTGTFLQELTPAAFVLADGAGETYTADSLSDDLSTITPEDGLLPATANVGMISFPLPAGPLPYELRFLEAAEYEVVTLGYDDLQAGAGRPELAAGSYQLDATMFSHNELLEMVDIQVYSATVTAETMTFYLGFVNQGIIPHNTIPTPTGYDSRLLDITREGAGPLAVSPSFETTVYSEDFLFPGEVYTGSITFARSPGMSAGYFVFEGYEPLYWAAAADGSLTAELRASDGESVAARPTPSPGEMAIEEILALLDRQAAALAAGDRAEHQSLLNPEAGEFALGLFDAMTVIPLQSVTMHYQPYENKDEEALNGRVNGLEMLVEVQPVGYGARYSHILELSYSLSRGENGWVIDGIVNEGDPLIWMRPDVVHIETEHYYLFASATFSDRLPAAAEEVEAGYAVLVDSALVLDQKYSAYYAETPGEFIALGGYSDLAGIALSKTRFVGGQWKVVDSFFMMNNEVIQEVPREIRVFYVAHELTHLVLAPFSRPAMPVWLLEGIAEYFSDTPQRVRDSNLNEVLALSVRDLTELGEFRTAGDADVYYGFSGALISYLAETYGEEQVLAFYYAYSELSFDETEEEMRVSLTERLVMDFFGVTLEELDGEFKGWLGAGNN